MTPDSWKRIKQIAGDVLERAPEDRAACTAAACAGDDELRAEVESLIEAAVSAEQLYETPALELIPALASAIDAHTRHVFAPGDRVGAYVLVREVGRGGMGSVYLAQRADGEFEQQVAIKFVDAIAAPDLVRRFKEERRILAALEHPDIARLIDGGTTPNGVPYVIMEYVDGVPIEAYCDTHGLSMRQRLALFQRVCVAVQYAHQRLVVHRDIKAANILVTAAGAPKLLDFGIAKFVQPDAPPTPTTLRAMTPESASPEQVRGETITIASDVYALGVLLYRLLTGRSPYHAALSNDAALLHAICDATPPAPSIDQEIDLIVLKALRKEPARRYGSAEQLSSDLTRYLTGRPVLAAPDSARYRATKFVHRHRGAVAAGIAAVIALVIGSAAAIHQAGIAREQRARAEHRLADVRRLANSFLFEFHDSIAGVPGSTKVRGLVVSRAGEYLDSLAREGQDDVALQRELAMAYQRIGDLARGPGSPSPGDVKSGVYYDASLRIRDRLAGDGRLDRSGCADIARTMAAWETVTAAQQQLDHALPRDRFTNLRALCP